MSGTGAGRGGKSRIVIDVESVRQQHQSRRSRGRGMGRGAKVLSITALVVAGLAALIIAGGFFWWRSYQRTPSYSLALLVDAAQRDDLRAVEELLDADRVAEGFVPQVVGRLTSGGANLNAAAVEQQARQIAPQLAPRVRESVRDEVARGVKSFAEKAGGNLPFVLLAAGIGRYADVTEEGDTAKVNFNIEGRAPLELLMQRSEERWKIVTIKDESVASSIAARIAPSIAAPAPAPAPQKPVRRRP